MEIPLKSRLFYGSGRFLLSNTALCGRIIYRVKDVIVFEWLCYVKC